jgi:hypothetical protein
MLAEDFEARSWEQDNWLPQNRYLDRESKSFGANSTLRFSNEKTISDSNVFSPSRCFRTTDVMAK